MTRRLLVCLAVFAIPLMYVVGDERAKPQAGKVQYAREILPILSGHCFTCHGPDEKTRKGGMRLDVAEDAMKPAKSGSRAIVPGKPAESELIVRIFSEGRDRMPPIKGDHSLKENEKQLLKTWIEQGAEYQRHWAFVAPVRGAKPQAADGGWGKNPIDAFVLAKLKEAGLKPSPEADRYTLARRVAIDLTGLPPRADLVERFIKDASPDAYEKYVDEILNLPAYGERWAAVWLDLARYADSNGYANDGPRTIWRFRDWVIEAINANMPYDRFTIEQLAGDLLPPVANAPGSPATMKQILATSFHRNTLTNEEGGTNREEFRTAAVVDRVNTTMQVWMGLTMACAQCHDHKFDPLSQEKYYKLFAIFNQTEDADRSDNAPLLTELTPEQEKQIADLKMEIAKLEKVIAEQKAAEAPPPQQGEGGANKGPLPTRHVRIELLGKGVYLQLAEVQVFVGEENVALKGKASQISTAFDGPAHLAIDGNTNGDYAGKSVSHTAAADNPWWEVDLGKAVNVDKVAVWNRTDGGTGARLNNWRIIALDEARKPVWVKSFKEPPNPSVAVNMPKTVEALDAAAKKELGAYLKGETAAKATPEQKKLDELKKQLAGIKGITTPIMKELPASSHRKTNILIRGNFLDKGKEVTPGVPAVFQAHGPPSVGVANRFDLAKWLVDANNPLTARVTVNRYWEQIFGRGLVETPEDWGIRGKYPTHPELLDWLATEFMAGGGASGGAASGGSNAPGATGWDVKRLLKLIVTSATYRQSSKVTPELLERDPDNRLLARGPRFRNSAEVIRDQALFVSGLLSPKLGGPPARPARPKLRLAAAFGGNTDWDASPGDDKYRRGLYTEWRRTTPYPSMVTFDAPNRSVCTVNRPRTNTPLQALVTLNDPCFVESAQALARRIVKDGGTTVESRIQYAFQLCLTRPAQERETQRLTTLYQEARERFSKNPKEAMAMATEPLGPLPAGMDAAGLAAWTVVGNVLLNLDEMFLKR